MADYAGAGVVGRMWWILTPQGSPSPFGDSGRKCSWGDGMSAFAVMPPRELPSFPDFEPAGGEQGEQGAGNGAVPVWLKCWTLATTEPPDRPGRPV